MIGTLRSELLKHKRTFTPWLVVLGPAGLIALFIFGQLRGRGALDYDQLLMLVPTWWSLLWVPFGAALLAALATSLEASGDAWRALRSQPVSPTALYGAKSAVLALHALIASAILIGLLAGLAAILLLPEQVIPWRTLALLGLLSWLSALPLLALHLWLALACGFAPTLALALGGFFAALIVAGRPKWVFLPWAWPFRS